MADVAASSVARLAVRNWRNNKLAASMLMISITTAVSVTLNVIVIART